MCHAERKESEKYACDLVSIKKKANEQRCVNAMESFINSDNESKGFSSGRHHTSCQQTDIGAECGNPLNVKGKNIACCRRQDGWLQLKHQPYIRCNFFGDLSWNSYGHCWHAGAVAHQTLFAGWNWNYGLFIFELSLLLVIQSSWLNFCRQQWCRIEWVSTIFFSQRLYTDEEYWSPTTEFFFSLCVFVREI